jgi:hypothetical protein
MALYSMVCLVGHRLNEEAPVIAERAAWYDKETVTFSDLLKAVRVVLWKDNLFFRKEFSGAFVEIQLEKEDLCKDWLVQMLARAA